MKEAIKMCKGIAILINDRRILMNEKNNSHSQLGKEDEFLKINVIYDDREKRGYRLEIDNHGSDQLENYKKQGYVTKEGKIITSYLKRLAKFCKENEHKFFRLFCKELQSAYLEGNQSNYSAEIKGYQYNDSAEIRGNQYNDSAEIGGNQRNYSVKIGGDQNNNSVEIKGDMIIYNMKVENEQTTKLIKEFSEQCKEWEEATLTNFIKWLKK